MPHPDPVPSPVLEHVAGQLGVDVYRAFGANAVTGKAVRLVETFAVWVLQADGVTRGSGDISHLVRPTGLWHHQIKIDGKAKGSAQSAPYGPDPQSWKVECIAVSPLAQKIDEAIAWVDKHVKKDPVVRLLEVPAYHLHAFWFFQNDQSQVLVIDMPPSFKHLELQKLYGSKEFLERLLKEQHAIGLAQ